MEGIQRVKGGKKERQDAREVDRFREWDLPRGIERGREYTRTSKNIRAGTPTSEAVATVMGPSQKKLWSMEAINGIHSSSIFKKREIPEKKTVLQAKRGVKPALAQGKTREGFR